MIKAMGRRLTYLSERYMPDPLLFAILLTFVVFVLGITLAGNSFMQMVNHWYKGFWNLLTFSMQMVLILVTGHALAVAPGVRNFLVKVAGIPKNNAQAAALTALVACIFGWINWGLGLIVGAIFALQVGKQAHAKGIKIHYPLVVAAGYASQFVWHWGLSSSAGLLMATEGHFLQDLTGIVPISETIFSTYALSLSVIMIFLVVPWIFYLMAPKDEECRGIESYVPELLEEDAATTSLGTKKTPDTMTFAEKLENSRAISYITALLGLVYIFKYFIENGFDLNLNIVNFTFLIVGIILHQTPIRYMYAIKEATKGASGIILQFPFYGGIMGMISGSGLAVIFAQWFLSFSTPFIFPVITWLTGAFMNIFVPSGGGEWAVIGEILSKVSLELGVPLGKTIVAYGTGDTWTNMLQPFWAIALLGITKLKAGDIIGYTLTLMILTAPIYTVLLLFLPY